MYSYIFWPDCLVYKKYRSTPLLKSMLCCSSTFPAKKSKITKLLGCWVVLQRFSCTATIFLFNWKSLEVHCMSQRSVESGALLHFLENKKYRSTVQQYPNHVVLLHFLSKSLENYTDNYSVAMSCTSTFSMD